MSRLSRLFSSLSIVVVLICFAGCATFHSAFGKKMLKATPSDPVAEMLCFWEPGEGIDPDKVPCKGFTGQILFLNHASKPVVVEGDVRIYLFDDQGTPEEQAKPLRQFDFDDGSWALHLADSSFGPKYNVFIPYVRRGVSNASCSIRIRLKSKEGRVVFSDFSSMPLNGHKKAAIGDDAKPITKEEVDLSAVESMTGKLRRTTTIPTGPSSQPAEVETAAKTDPNSKQVQFASYEVPAAPNKESADADRIRRLESMVEKLLEQKANSAATPPPQSSSVRPRRDVAPEELDQHSNNSESALESPRQSPRQSRRIRMRRNDDETVIRSSPVRRNHPLDDDQPVRSRSRIDDEFVQDPVVDDESESSIETTYVPRSVRQSERYQRSSR